MSSPKRVCVSQVSEESVACNIDRIEPGEERDFVTSGSDTVDISEAFDSEVVNGDHDNSGSRL